MKFTAPRVTTRGLWLLSPGVGFGFLDFLWSGAGWAGLIWTTWILIVLLWEYRRIDMSRVQLTRAFARRFSLGLANPVTLNLQNSSPQPITIELEEGLVWSLDVTPRHMLQVIAVNAPA